MREHLLVGRALLLPPLQLQFLLGFLVGVEDVDLQIVERDIDLVHVLDRRALVQERLDLVMEEVLLLSGQHLKVVKAVRLHTLHPLTSPLHVTGTTRVLGNRRVAAAM